MKRVLSIVICFFVVVSFAQKDELRRLHPESANFFKICKTNEKEFKKEGTNKIGEPGEFVDDEYSKFKRWQWFWKDRILPDGSFPDISNNMKYHSVAQKLSKAYWSGEDRSDPTWKLISQTSTTGGYNGMGRTTCTAFHPTDANTFYVGSPQGGLWKTTNNGQSYAPLTDALPYTAVGSCVVDPVEPNTIYITCGDHSGWWTYSIGVYKSTDGGTTWAPTGLMYTLAQGVAMFKLLIDPFDHNLIYLAASNGVYKSVNGGVQWTKVKDGFYSDIAFEPGTSNLYAAQHDYWGSSEIYSTTNKGLNWSKLSNFNMKYNWIRLAVSPANPSILAASNSSDNSLYVSYSKGANLNKIGNMPAQSNGNAENAVLFISPTNANVFYAGYVNIYKSTTGGTNWKQQTLWYGGGGYPEVHADHHNITYSPINKKQIWFNCDGGVYRYDETADSWTDFSKGLAITQFYRIAISQKDSKFMIGGTQDNGGRKMLSNGNWAATNGGDAMEVAIDPTNDNIIYTTYVNGKLYRSNDKWVNDQYYEISSKIPGGKPNGSWITPYMIDPNASSTLVAGYNDVFITTNKGESWAKISNSLTGSVDNTLNCLQIAASDSKIIYCSRNNTLYKTINQGTNWSTITVPDNGDITSITIHPTNSNIIWLTKNGYNAGQKVYKSTNGGNSWVNISGTLPNIPVNCMIYEKGSKDALYIGTDIGVYYRSNNLTDWVPFTLGLPNTEVSDLEIQYEKKLIRAATYGRGIWESALAQPELITPNLVLDNFKFSNTDSLLICVGQNIQFDPQAKGTGKWSWTGPKGFNSSLRDPQLIADLSNSGEYVVTYTDKYGISSIQKYAISVIDKPSVMITAQDSSLCPGQQTILSTSGYNLITWLPSNITNSQLQVIADSSVSYMAFAKVNLGCTDTAFFKLNVFPKPEMSLIQDKVQICAEDSLMLVGSGMKSYFWKLSSDTFTTDTVIIHLIIDTEIILIGLDSNGCSDTLTSSVKVVNNPTVVISASSSEICMGDTVLLTSSQNNANLWSTAEITNTINIKPDSTQEYTVLHIDGNGCKASDSISILVHDNPSKPNLVQNMNTIFTSSDASNYSWYFKGKLLQSGPLNSITADQSGFYTLIVTDKFGCSSKDSIQFILTGVNEINDKYALSITPNPGHGIFKISYQLGILQNVELFVSDASGKVIWKGQSKADVGEVKDMIDLSSVPKGQYELCLRTNSGIICKALIIQ